ncbi:Coenzyme F420 hydrogenase/dehydrogenase, beta subunit C-terminal domain [Pseudobutyrivibrio xylanivorans]|uniref:Coenzyme F420-reducing hydrogenase, beta subunit n=1 Tax=Pseudobutyrivibrio xylanivorans TaxID=185007 RepID=A0A1G5S0B5_PSEXY|nr:Coenzyme F420 hydrogenase/dehydrogenase, beta subunit C-terminal domain [Pseudobutyrivibrio xylanivorans]SCZ79703.1 Coenzyme F420-reducing hydrogenase, beta subunit [Pseudobutyrivibrio xylanivorans]
MLNSEAYACINTNEETRVASSSGGLYSLIAEYFVNNGGIIYAAVYDENLLVKHTRITTIEEIASSRGAKYVFSRVGDVFNQVLDDLKDGSKVMFVGSPCQCAGLIALTKEYRDNLLIVDFVCHGVPGVDVWKDYLQAFEKRNGSLAAVNMRCKKTGWSMYSYCWELKCADGKVIYERQQDNPYMKGFSQDITLREACFNCKNKGFNRETDITLGDFWGIGEMYPEMDDNKGTSLIIVHSEKGSEILKEIEGSVKIIHVLEDEAVKHNPSILHSAQKNSKRDLFNRNREQGIDYIDNIELLCRKTIMQKLQIKIRRFKYKIKKNHKKIG